MIKSNLNTILQCNCKLNLKNKIKIKTTINLFSTSSNNKSSYSRSGDSTSTSTSSRYQQSYNSIDKPRSSDPRYEDDPRLPTTSRLPTQSTSSPPITLNSITPVLLQALRLHIMSQTARPPTILELEKALPSFLKRERAKEEKRLKLAFGQVKRKINVEQQMDVARKWAEDMEIKVGLLKQDERERIHNQKLDLERSIWKRNGRDLEEFEEVVRNREKRTEDDTARILRSKRYRNLADPPPLSTTTITTAPISPQLLESTPAKYKSSIKSPVIAVGSERPLFTSTPSIPTPPSEPLPDWRIQKEALKDKFPSGWMPPKVISTEAKSLLKLLQRSNPVLYTTSLLADRFKISAEAVRRILKSQFELPPEIIERREKKRLEERARNGGGEDWGGNVGKQREEMRMLREGAMEKEKEQERNSSRYNDDRSEYRNDTFQPIPTSTASLESSHPRPPYSSPASEESNSYDRPIPPTSTFSDSPRSNSQFNNYDRTKRPKTNDRRDRPTKSSYDRGSSRGSNSSGNSGPKQVSWTD